MTTYINADDGIVSGVAGLKYGADNSGSLVLQTNGTTAITISASQVVTFAGAVSLGALTTSGNLTFTGTGNRILGDFSNSTASSRVLFQSSTTNGVTSVAAIPNGTSTSAFVGAYNSSAGNDCPATIIRATSTENSLLATGVGTFSYLPMTFYTGGSERMRIDTSGNVFIGGTSGPVLGYEKFGAYGSAGFKSSGTAALGLWNTNASGVLTTFYIGSATSVGTFSSAGTDFSINTTAVLNLSAAGANYITLNTNSAERMRIDSSGNVGIGVTSISAKLQVAGTLLNYSASAGQTELQLGASRTNDFIFISGFGSPQAVNGYTVFGLRAYSNLTGSNTIVGASEWAHEGTGTDTKVYYVITTNNGTSNLERMRITSAGGVSFGNTGTAYGSSGQLLQSNGNAPPSWVNSPVYTAEFLVIGGGGGGGNGVNGANTEGGGGGGAGGYRSSVSGESSGGGASAEAATVLSTGAVYTVTVGAGGASGGSVGNNGSPGGSSVFGGITSAGGGYGAGNSKAGGAGGCGGGAGSQGTNAGGSGTSGQGYAGGSGADGAQSGGGGGAGAVGVNSGTYITGGNGGNGVSSSITGSAVTRGGGGGAGSYNRGTGGSGGGGLGGAINAGLDSTAGTANTGGGGGGGGAAGSSRLASAGGSGIVIIRYLGSQRGTGGTVTSSGGYTIHTFTTSGTYTA